MKRGEVFEDSRGLRKPLKRRREEDTRRPSRRLAQQVTLDPRTPAPLTQPGVPRILPVPFTSPYDGQHGESKGES